MRETLRRLERLEREIEVLKQSVREAIVHARSVAAKGVASDARRRRKAVRHRPVR